MCIEWIIVIVVLFVWWIGYRIVWEKDRLAGGHDDPLGETQGCIRGQPVPSYDSVTLSTR